VATGRFAGLELDLTPHAGGALGNVYTYANAGFTVRYGKRLVSDLGPMRIRPSPPGSGFFVPADTFSWYAFVGVDGAPSPATSSSTATPSGTAAA